jgi:thymidylate kinase
MFRSGLADWRIQYRLANLRSHWVELVGVAAAFASFDGLIFAALGRKPRSTLEWGAFFLVLIAGLVAMWVLLRLRKPRSVLVLDLDHAQMTKTMQHAKRQASRKLVNFAGDLTWLPQDLGLMRELVEAGRKVEVFYESVGTGVHAALAEAVQAGVRLRRLPVSLRTLFRCVVTDPDASEDCQVFVVEKKPASVVLRERNRYLVSHHTAANNESLILAVRHLYELSRAVTHVQLKVAVVGTNNVGKTTAVDLLAQRLREGRWDVRLLEDVFRGFEETTIEANLQMLARQVIAESQAQAATVVCDRALIDNFIFMKHRFASKPGCWKPLEPMVIEHASTYDIVFLLDPAEEPATEATAHVDSELRAGIAEGIRKFLIEHHVEFERFQVTDEGRAAAVDAMIKAIKQRLAQKVQAA